MVHSTRSLQILINVRASYLSGTISFLPSWVETQSWNTTVPDTGVTIGKKGLFVLYLWDFSLSSVLVGDARHAIPNSYRPNPLFSLDAVPDFFFTNTAFSEMEYWFGEERLTRCLNYFCLWRLNSLASTSSGLAKMPSLTVSLFACLSFRAFVCLIAF